MSSTQHPTGMSGSHAFFVTQGSGDAASGAYGAIPLLANEPTRFPGDQRRFDWPFSAHELPRIDRLAPNLFAASFPLMKLLPARYALQAAEEQGLIGPGSHVIESTSGTFGLALAMLSSVRRYQLTLISDPVIDVRLQRRLRELGARVEIIPAAYSDGSVQTTRLERLRHLLSQHPGAFWPDQNGNPNIPRAYARVAAYLVDQLGPVDCLVGSVGTGGSMVGTASSLRHTLPDLTVIGVDTCRSLLFGQHNGPRMLRGLGNSLIPANLDYTLFDYVSWVPAHVAFNATRLLHRRHALYMGGTSGAAFIVANWWAQSHGDAKVVVLFPDEGHRYVDTIYDDAWLARIPGAQDPLSSAPGLVDHPHQGETMWSWFAWKHRRLEDVVGDESEGRER